MVGVEWVIVARVPSSGDCPSFSLYSVTWPCSTLLAVCSPPHPASVPVPVPVPLFPSSLCVDGTQGTVLSKCSITGLCLLPLLTEDRVKALNSDPPASEGHLCVDLELGNFPPRAGACLFCGAGSVATGFFSCCDKLLCQKQHNEARVFSVHSSHCGPRWQGRQSGRSSKQLVPGIHSRE